MLSLANVDAKFQSSFKIIENGAGVFKGVIDEISQTQVPTYVFAQPRRMLRVPKLLPINPTMVIESQGGSVFLIGLNGDSESAEGTVFRSYRLFQCLQKFKWERRMDRIDVVTGLPGEESIALMNPPYIWGSYNPSPEQFDRETHVSIETATFVTNHPIQRQDRIDGKNVVRVDKELDLYIANLE